MHAPRGPRPTSVGVVVAAEFVPASVLDASALLAWLQGEQGADLVIEALAAGTVISVFNWVEALSKVADTGHNPETLVAELARLGFDRETLPIEGVTDADAMEIARLRPLTRTHGLSICDRACLALAERLALPVVTADREWVSLDLGVTVTLIR
jgi:ribonuclease VapC